MPASAVPIVNPRTIAWRLIGKWINVKGKWGRELKGRLVFSDRYLNFELELVEQYDGETLLSLMQNTLLRWDVVEYFRELNDEECERIVSNWQSRGDFYEFQQQN
ncbi:hypothetical protein TNCT_256641 [Trichonephila clavata]|uniref:Sm domain-containing protein n=1 Tax=Trichonephila clavata TaxID=2740835 RepID=A0A8X6LLI4_TRICU|nr:hypothetical protein TNCT_256641 [Trichonephila clavata]